MRATTMWMGVLLAVVAAGGVAQVRGPVTAPPLISSDGAEMPIVLQSAQLSVQADGGIARSTIELVLRNPNARQLEGQLQFPLLPGQQVVGFALDFDGQLRPAVPVPKAKGRQVFEAIERRGVDPALLEQTQGQHFRLRVYPIPARGTRRVQLTFIEPMQREAGGWLLRLPLQFAAPANGVDLRVAGGSAMPRITGTFAPVALRSDGAGYVARLPRTSYRADTALDLHFAGATQARAYTQALEGEHYFFAEVPLAVVGAARPLPKVLGLLWDSSGSGRQRDHAGELALLDRYLRAAGDIEVRLIRLRDRADPIERHVVRGGDWSVLRRSLQATVYDGATDPGGWTVERDVGEYLLVSDGLFNYGQRRLPALRKSQRLYTLNSVGAAADNVRLSALAQAAGGRAITWQGAGEIERAAQELLHDGPRVMALDASGADGLAMASDRADAGYLRIAGRLTQPQARVRIRIAEAGRTRSIELPVAADGSEGGLAAHLWADYTLRTLRADPERNRAAIARLGQRFGIVTPETSLIVLDTVSDYVRYDIAPPAAYRAEFARLKAEQGKAEHASRQQHLDGIAAEYAERIRWWSTAFPKDRPAAKHVDLRPMATAVIAQASAEAATSQRETPAPPPAPSAAPASARRQLRAASPASADSLDRIEVTGSRIDASAAASGGDEGAGASIALQAWQPDSPVARRLRAAAPGRVYALYLDERDSYANSTAFYLDVADVLFAIKQPRLALRVLSNLAELELENRQVLRVLGYRLLLAGQPGLALPVFEQVARLAEEEPQSFRDLGLAHAAAGQPQRAVDTLYEVVQRPWDGRFSGVAMIALAELNAVIATAHTSLDTARIDPRLRRNLPLDLRAVLSWDSDNSDMDLWVTDPDGERCYYSNRNTHQGGRLSNDFTGGYGPEEFVLREAKPGKYKVEANFFGDRQQLVTGATTLHLWLSTGFGTVRQDDQKVTLRLRERSETVLVGEFEVR
ncbi:VIT domain-containing protein [Lysobacter koreensis]|uniref:VIT domain-containing protein n=1 Tax=Lysobacter koreensis TaxID=266122 RepID=A0ABW2YIX3_9GAMM